MTKTVGPNTNETEVRQIANESAAIKSAAICEANGIDAKINDLRNGKQPDNTNSKPASSPHAQVYGDVGLTAMTGGSSSFELLQAGGKIVQELTDKNLGGMEKPIMPSDAPQKVARDIAKENCIKTPPFFSLTERDNALAGSFMGDDETTGMQADLAKSIGAFKATRDACNVIQRQAELVNGFANSHTAQLGAEQRQTRQAGGAPAPGGIGGGIANINQAPYKVAQNAQRDLTHNQYKPKGPSHMKDGDTNSDEAGAA